MVNFLPGRYRWIVIAALLAVSFLGWRLKHGVKLTQSRELLGTRVSLVLLTRDQDQGRAVLARAWQAIESWDKIYSDRRPDSELWRINQQAGQDWVRVSPEMARIIDRAFHWHRLTDGLFDITVGGLGEAWGFKQESDPGGPPSREKIQELLAVTGMDKLAWEPQVRRIRFKINGLRLDLGGIAKLEILLNLRKFFRAQGEQYYLVNLGGDVLAGGRRFRKWKVGITDPSHPEQLFTRLEVRESLVLTSGDYFRKFSTGEKTFHHILDPRTGYPRRTAKAATIIMPADHPEPMPSLVLFLLGPKPGINLLESLPDMEGFLLEGERTYFSSGMKRF